MLLAMNRRLVLDGPAQLRVEDAELPPLAPGHARIEVAAAGICGSDVHGFAGVNGRRPPGVVMGHEVGGTVVAVADEHPGAFAPGDLVVVNPILACGRCAACERGDEHLCERRMLYGCTTALPGGFAEQMDVQVENLVPFGDAVPREWSALVEPLAVGAHAVERARARGGERALVVGGGPIGLACALAAGRAGVDATLSEPVAARRRTAAALGIAACAPDAASAAGPFEVVFECVGLQSTVAAALALSGPGARIVCVGLAEPQLSVPAEALVIEERTLIGSSAYSRAAFASTAAWVAGGGLDLAPMIAERRALADLPAAFTALAAGAAPAGKVVMTRA